MKLKKLILAGFKSFADRTEFEFDDGISCVVGPNGCGKSNVVDAIKWVLGEQSAKSLRGSEMMDVIFNGSSGRKPAGSAEVTLVFDNSSGKLKPAGDDAPATTVSVARRLFRNGNSEYLINKAPARLRDIREMFMDTGVGVDAYSVIEQGRVEAFLQSSQEDRRAIFDEAAGISKYKARRKEALRKLERVDQNLLRLTDIVGEVEKRLRSIKHQAGKARNYQGYTERLKELRSLHLMAQYHSLSNQRTGLHARLDAGAGKLSAVTGRIEQFEAARSAADIEAADLERISRDLEGRLAATGGMITAGKQRAEMLQARVGELNDQIVSAGQRCQELQGKIHATDAEFAARSGELDQIEAQLGDMTGRYEVVRDQHTTGEMEITRLSAMLEDEKAGTIDLFRRTAQLHNEIQGLNIRRENLHNQRTRLAGRAEEIAASLRGMIQDRMAITGRLAEIGDVLSASRARHDEARHACGKLVESEQTLQGKLSSARERRSGLLSRIDALKEMQQRLEGVGAGVRRVLKACGEGKLPAIKGMLGDFIETATQHAPLVEAALAGADQQLLAESFDAVHASAGELAGILGENGSLEILCLDRLETLKSDFDLNGVSYGDADTTEVAAEPVVLGRIIDFVRCDVDLAPAIWRLLGKTLVVKTLADAAAGARQAPEGYRFVTLAGEVLEADGRLRLGSAKRATGVITRRSELAELAIQRKELDDVIAQLDEQCRTTKAQRQHMEELDQNLRQAIYEANTERVECESRLGQLETQIAKLQREEPVIAGDVARLAEAIESSVASEQQAKTKAAELEKLNTERQAEVHRLAAEIAALTKAQSDLTAQLTELKVALAQTQQKKLALKEAQAALVRQREATERDLTAVRSQAELNKQRVVDAENGISAALAETERLQVQEQALRTELQEAEESRRGLAEKLQEIHTQLAEIRKTHEQTSAEVNALRVELGEADVRVENLIARAQDEMGMNLLERYAAYQHDENRDWATVELEINDLRGKIERLGNVNLDAITEQEELEKRSEFLGAQLKDIRSSQEQLSDLIRRINKESRDMFVATFETIRANFQELFRKLFGGGKADIMLADPDDVLESDIEIVARPPGKELRSITLLSGGEKTMTALGLLFSIFRSRPSPFCLLDEVDAALDEANNQRFGMLVSEFMTESQFIVISHSKRTMSMANVLYGVTMQEPGVSKRISVRFEEVEQVEEDTQFVNS